MQSLSLAIWVSCVAALTALKPALLEGTTLNKLEIIVAKLRQLDVILSRSQSVTDAVRAVGVTEVT